METTYIIYHIKGHHYPPTPKKVLAVVGLVFSISLPYFQLSEVTYFKTPVHCIQPI